MEKLKFNLRNEMIKMIKYDCNHDSSTKTKKEKKESGDKGRIK